MNVFTGSMWAKWDLHVHTPESLVHHFNGDDPWEAWLNEIESLPPEFKVIGINDYLFVDGYERVLKEKANGRLSNIELFLPVLELRLDKFGGTHNRLSRVNYHVIFSDEITPDVIRAQFIAGLSKDIKLSPDNAHSGIQWSGVVNKQSLVDLGSSIINSVPLKERVKYHSPLIEGFNNLCFSLDAIKEILKGHYFRDKVLTTIGKTEWADVKWNDSTIAEKKNIINSVDLVFISTDSVEAYNKAKKSLTDAGVNDRLLDCSDSHHLSSSHEKDRIGNSRTWIKSESTFEGLRQAVIEFDSRVIISDDIPLTPPLRIHSADFSFPSDTKFDGSSSDNFCFRGKHRIEFSPYFTCLVGGRGSGKSTLLSLLHEHSSPGKNKFFKDNKLKSELGDASILNSVTIESSVPLNFIEYLHQNEIEQFALDPSQFTPSIFSRIKKYDNEKKIDAVGSEIEQALQANQRQKKNLIDHDQLTKEIDSDKSLLESMESLVSSFKDEEYISANKKLSEASEELQTLRYWQEKLNTTENQLSELFEDDTAEEGGVAEIEESSNQFEKRYQFIRESVKSILEYDESDLKEAVLRIQVLEEEATYHKNEISNFLKGRGLSVENLSQVENASQTIAEIKQKLPESYKKLQELSSAIVNYSSKESLLDNYLRVVNLLLEPINVNLEGLSTEVKSIYLQYSFCVDSFENAVISMIAEKFEPRLRSDYASQTLENVDLQSLTTKEAFLEKIPDTSKVGMSIREYFSVDLNFELLKLEVENQILNVAKHNRIEVQYGGRPLEKTSFGQRCTAALVILLLMGNTPIVLDEPESHLDSALIAKYLVQLIKKIKINRQVIFATHNANFVINGDSELIHILQCSDDNSTEITSTTIENILNRGHLLSLEGGREAFDNREKRYRQKTGH